MNESNLQKEQNWLVSGSLMVIAMVAVGIVLLYAQSILVPFVLAVFISLLIAAFLDFQIIRLKVPRILAVTITLIIVLIVLTVLFLFVSQGIRSIVSTTSRYSESFVQLSERIFPKLEEWGITSLNQTEIVETVQQEMPKLIAKAVGPVSGFIADTFLILIFVVFLLIGRNSQIVRKGLYAEIDRQVRRYITIKVIVSSITGCLVWAVLALFGLELAGVFGMLAFLLNFIPSIGSIIATLLPLPVAAVQFQSAWPVLLVVAIPGAIQITVGNVIEPKLMGSHMHLHPVTILLALSFWALLWGIPGMFLAVPMTAVLRIILMQFETLKPIGNLLAGQLPELKTVSD
jgi:AI-2 transport protein TqsA